tara:strand:+ start:6079 stop:7653 length:1575 start_codon:yes stop_codon:yes gene_type:complete
VICIDEVFYMSIRQWIDLLDSDKQGKVRYAGNELLKAGKKALPALLKAARHPSSRKRRAVAYLLGRVTPSQDVFEALKYCLSDEEPKVRKNAAISLGTVGTEDVLDVLVDALSKEMIVWVRPSLVLAIGQIGGEKAHAALADVESQTEKEAEALRKALARTEQIERVCAWAATPPMNASCYVSCPDGFEDVVAQEALSLGLPEPKIAGSGLLTFPKEVHPKQCFPAMRCIHQVRFLIGRRKLKKGDDKAFLEAISSILSAPEWIPSWREWVALEGKLPFRLAIHGKRLKKPLFVSLLEEVREVCGGYEWEDRPSNYMAELRIESTSKGVSIWCVPTFMEDDRFVYRVEDVGASIHPVVGACLARFVRKEDSQRIFDPTCGSATLLIERALLDEGTHLLGVDVSPTAMASAKTNIQAAQLSKRISLKKADMREPIEMEKCDEMLMNLPFGIRSRKQDKDLKQLYLSIFRTCKRSLKPKGRAAIFSANGKLVKEALGPVRKAFHIREQRITHTGGLQLGIWLLERK